MVAQHPTGIPAADVSAPTPGPALPGSLAGPGASAAMAPRLQSSWGASRVRARAALIVAACLQLLLAALFTLFVVSTTGGGSAVLICFGLALLHIVLGVALWQKRRTAIVGYLVLSIGYGVFLAVNLADFLSKYAADPYEGLVWDIVITSIALVIVLGINALTLPYLRRAR